jgi:hypothetical protein
MLRRLVELSLWVAVALLCLTASAAMLILPDKSKVIDLVYGGF